MPPPGARCSRPRRTLARIWLNHLTLGPILAEGRPGRWYAPSAARQVWRWYRPAEPDALDPFSGWLPFEALAVKETGTAPMDESALQPSRIFARCRAAIPGRPSWDRTTKSDDFPPSA